jgi:hypothetical protein
MKKLLIRLIDWILSKLNRRQVEFVEINKEEVKEKLQEVKKSTEKYNYRKGRLVWNSRLRGTYIRAIHGKLA